MTQSEEHPLFTVSNHHFPGTGSPPSVDGDEPNHYHSYFENRYGEQSIFVYKKDTDEAMVLCGDADWNAYPVINGEVQGLLLSKDEQIWLKACLQACGAGK
jgi:hypothetical protein